MIQKMKAAILVEQKKPLVISEVELPKALDFGQVFVKIQYSGICGAQINEIEAGHRTVFVAGWRPFIGWVCGVALAYNFIIRDLFIWALDPQEVPPALQMEHLMTVLLGMLGLGGLRTYEKVKDKTK